MSSSKLVRPSVENLSETVWLRHSWTASDDEACRSGSELYNPH